MTFLFVFSSSKQSFTQQPRMLFRTENGKVRFNSFQSGWFQQFCQHWTIVPFMSYYSTKWFQSSSSVRQRLKMNVSPCPTLFHIGNVTAWMDLQRINGHLRNLKILFTKVRYLDIKGWFLGTFQTIFDLPHSKYDVNLHTFFFVKSCILFTKSPILSALWWIHSCGSHSKVS